MSLPLVSWDCCWSTGTESAHDFEELNPRGEYLCEPGWSVRYRMFVPMEGIEVQWTTAGQPLRVRRHGRAWKVVAEPVRWFERFAWWETELRVPKG